ncbi:MAG: YbaB/EbfC family nucleoid-associated protein [Corallococcus sp.]|nr:YbaB/EbfC family nucleoid-associated protein [Corallococcus sp.]
MGNKYGYNGAGGGFGGGGGMQNLMKQAQQMQQKLQEAQQQLEELEVTGSASGDMVQVTVNGKKNVLSVRIKPEACDPDDTEMLEDLIMAAIQDAYARAQAEEDRIMAPFAAMKGLL